MKSRSISKCPVCMKSVEKCLVLKIQCEGMSWVYIHLKCVPKMYDMFNKTSDKHIKEIVVENL